ncbi:MAG TPA: tetratricopeptide repeat protein [Vicinamibacterales bacterium]|nr:tetratricopeptide repeat protein [Vicinamibacterales bacterium]
MDMYRWLPCTLATAVALVALGASQARQVTFTSDVAPILFDHCAQCHRPGGSAPFSLITYAAAKQHATQIAAATRRRVMPPWKSEPGYGEFIGHRPLTDRQIDLLRRWADEGTREGDRADLPPAPRWTDGWQLGSPDLVVTLAQPYVLAADGADVSRVFVLPVPIDAVRYVKGVEFQPGNPAVVHHANIRIDRTPASRALDEQDPDPGYEGVMAHSAVYPDGHFLGWTPGQIAPLLPKGLAWRLAPRTDLVVEVHMKPSGKVEQVKPSIALYFGSDPPERTPAMIRLGRQSIDIAPGEKDYAISDSFVLPVDAEVQAVQPHAHYRAREVQGVATLPDGTTRWLIYIKDWDFRWQHVYRYVAPFTLPKGTTLSVRYRFDNSAGNPRNPRLPPVRVAWGQWTQDEMGDLWIQVLTRTESDLQTLNTAFHAKAVAEDIVGYESMIRRDPRRVQLHDDVAQLFLETGRAADAVAHLAASARLRPDSAPAQFNLGTALTIAGRLDEAIDCYRRALAIDPNYALAHNNLGNALLARGHADQALDHFREALRLDPSNAEAHYNVGSVARARGDLAGALDRFRRALALRPDWVPAIASLAWLLSTAPDAALRDPDQAIRFAERAVDLTGRREPSALDVLAAAYAAAGQFDRAVETCDLALEMKPDAVLASAIRQRRELYMRRQPFRSP